MEELIKKLKEQIKSNYELANEYKERGKIAKKEAKSTNQWAIYVAIRDTTKDIEKIIQQYEQQ